MQDRFRGKTWIYWAQLGGCGSLGFGGVILGVLFWTRTMTDARENPRRKLDRLWSSSAPAFSRWLHSQLTRLSVGLHR